MTRRLDLFGTVHIDRLSKVDRELTNYVEEADADAVFVEKPSDEATRWTLVGAILRAPVVFLGTFLAGVLQGALFAVFNRQLLATEHVVADRLAERYPVHDVDRSLLSLMAESGPLAILANWVVVGFLVVTPIQTAGTAGVVLVGGLAVNLAALRSRRLAAASALCVLAGFVVIVYVSDFLNGWFSFALALAFVVFAVRTLDTRNRHMIERIETITDDEEYDSGVLVVGRGHLSGLVKLAADTDLVLSRTYTPRWLRAPGKIDETPTVESNGKRDETTEKRPVEPGSVGARAGAALIDFVVLAVLVWVPALGLAVVTDAVFGEVISGLIAGLLVGPLAYYVVLEAAFGRTVGKRLTKLVVTDTDGSSPSVWACLLRNLVRPVDFVVFYLVGALVMALTRRHQRLGDLVAGTEVRKTD